MKIPPHGASTCWTAPLFTKALSTHVRTQVEGHWQVGARAGRARLGVGTAALGRRAQCPLATRSLTAGAHRAHVARGASGGGEHRIFVDAISRAPSDRSVYLSPPLVTACGPLLLPTCPSMHSPGSRSLLCFLPVCAARPQPDPFTLTGLPSWMRLELVLDVHGRVSASTLAQR